MINVNWLHLFLTFILQVKTSSIWINKNLVRHTSMKPSRIQHGKDVKLGEHTYVIILSDLVDSLRLCTGSMITEEWGITAGHCSAYNIIYAWYGNFTEWPFENRLYTEVKEVIIHPGYRLLTLNKGREDLIVDNDICLFRVFPKINFTYYGRLSSIDRAALIGLSVTYVGGGMTKMKPTLKDYFRKLQTAEGLIIICDQEMQSKSKYVICITPKCSQRMSRPWYGDSGGPLIYDGKIIGVASYVIESDNIARAGFAPVSPYIDWIYNVIHTKFGTPNQ